MTLIPPEKLSQGQAPKLRVRTFRVLAFGWLAVITVLWLIWLIRDAGLYGWLHPRLSFFGARESHVIGALLAFLAIFPLWIGPTMILRARTNMLPLQDDLARQGPLRDAIQDNLAAQRQQQARMLDLPPHALVRQRFYRQMGWLSIGVGLGAALITWIVWYISGAIWPVLLVTSLVGILGGLLSIITGRPILYDAPKIQHIQHLVKRFGIIAMIVALVFASVMCVIQALR